MTAAAKQVPAEVGWPVHGWRAKKDATFLCTGAIWWHVVRRRCQDGAKHGAWVVEAFGLSGQSLAVAFDGGRGVRAIFYCFCFLLRFLRSPVALFPSVTLKTLSIAPLVYTHRSAHPPVRSFLPTRLSSPLLPPPCPCSSLYHQDRDMTLMFPNEEIILVRQYLCVWCAGARSFFSSSCAAAAASKSAIKYIPHVVSSHKQSTFGCYMDLMLPALCSGEVSSQNVVAVRSTSCVCLHLEG